MVVTVSVVVSVTVIVGCTVTVTVVGHDSVVIDYNTLVRERD